MKPTCASLSVFQPTKSQPSLDAVTVKSTLEPSSTISDVLEAEVPPLVL